MNRAQVIEASLQRFYSGGFLFEQAVVPWVVADPQHRRLRAALGKERAQELCRRRHQQGDKGALLAHLKGDLDLQKCRPFWEGGRIVNVIASYHAYIQHYSQRYFDAYAREPKTIWPNRLDAEFETSLAQMNFLRWMWWTRALNMLVDMHKQKPAKPKSGGEAMVVVPRRHASGKSSRVFLVLETPHVSRIRSSW